MSASISIPKSDDRTAALKLLFLALDDLQPVQLMLHQLAQDASEPGATYGEETRDALVGFANQAIAATTAIDAAINVLGGLEAIKLPPAMKPN